MNLSTHSTECLKRIELRERVYSILGQVDMGEGNQPSLLRLAHNPEWKTFISLLYSHIRTCPACRTANAPRLPQEASTIPDRRYS